MSDHIDHAAEAILRVNQALAVAREVGSSPETPILAAQVQATLALAEQQRIANLIALASLADRDATHEELANLARDAVYTLMTHHYQSTDDGGAE